MTHFTLTTPTSRESHFDELDFWDEDSINQQAYLEQLERDLSMGFPRYIEPLVVE